jgi:hypothetical protein
VRATALLLVLVAGGAGAADFEGQARVWLGPGFDSNARRDYVSAGVATLPDAFLYALGQLGGSLRLGERVQLRGGYEVGGRLFLLLPGEDTVLQSAQLSARVQATDWLLVGLAGRARDRRGADRNYTDLQGGLTLDFVPDPHLSLAVEVDAHRFLYWSRFAVSFHGPEVQVTARYRFDRHHGLTAWGLFSPRAYDAAANPRPPPAPPPLPSLRADTVLAAGVAYAYRGPFQVSASYEYLDDTSTSYGETLRRHRLSVAGGVSLPWELTALGQATLQFTLFPDGVYLSPELSVADDDENSSSVSVKLVRALGAHVELDVRYAFYFNQLPNNHLEYQRHVVTLGVAFTY